MKIVLDTCILKGCIDEKEHDQDCIDAIETVARLAHRVVVCEKLMWEYRGVLSEGSNQQCVFVDSLLRCFFPDEMWLMHNDPRVKIEFGPLKDRFHMQLAIDARAQYHVTDDRAVLREVKNMARYDVRERKPEQYTRECATRARPAKSVS